jgi:hypothetical protein
MITEKEAGIAAVILTLQNKFLWHKNSEFRRNSSTIDKSVCIFQILEKKGQYNGTVHNLFVDL